MTGTLEGGAPEGGGGGPGGGGGGAGMLGPGGGGGGAGTWGKSGNSKKNATCPNPRKLYLLHNLCTLTFELTMGAGGGGPGGGLDKSRPACEVCGERGSVGGERGR